MVAPPRAGPALSRGRCTWDPAGGWYSFYQSADTKGTPADGQTGTESWARLGLPPRATSWAEGVHLEVTARTDCSWNKFGLRGVLEKHVHGEQRRKYKVFLEQLQQVEQRTTDWLAAPRDDVVAELQELAGAELEFWASDEDQELASLKEQLWAAQERLAEMRELALLKEQLKAAEERLAEMRELASQG